MIVPLDPVIARGRPSAVAPRSLVTFIVVASVVGASVMVAKATTPGAIVLVFRPLSIHVYSPGEAIQERDFPAALDTTPALIDTARISTVE